jgi:hypothetical protein
LADSCRWFITATSTSVTRNTNVDSDVGVQGNGLGPVVPDVKVEVPLCCGTRNIAIDTAAIVVELDENGIKVDSTSQHRTISIIGVDTLRGSCHIVFF